MSDKEAIDKLTEARAKLTTELKQRIVGQDEVISQILVTLLAQGHCILIGVPGLAKTLIVNTLADALSLAFNRIQFTPDLMPSDITGIEVIDSIDGKRDFRFVKGPIFANMVLADEINRTPPKTQSALLQAMQEYNVTVSGTTYNLEQPFFVLATQNPIEQEGTYPLPEAQLDRFMFEIEITYPSQEEEEEIVDTTTSAYVPVIKKALTSKEILELQSLVRRVPVSRELIRSAVRLVSLTRPNSNTDCPQYIKDWIAWGASPRASQYLILGAKARSILEGRYTPSIDDVRYVATPVLRHRLITNFNAEAEGVTSLDIIQKLLNEI
jgi:MoxR-like ATPase